MNADIIAKLESASGPDRELDARIEIAMYDGGGHADDRDNTSARLPLISHGSTPGHFEIVAFSGVSLRASRPYTASLDAALALAGEKQGETGRDPSDLLLDAINEMHTARWRPENPVGPQIARQLLIAIFHALETA